MSAMSQELREYVRVLLALGRDDFEAIVEKGAEFLDEEGPVQRVATEEFRAYLEDQRTWPDVTDTDRLLRAFRELDTAGIVARTEFACCQSCGMSEIGAEVPKGALPRGYVFCHGQDMEFAALGSGLPLAYGVFTDGGGASTQTRIGEDVAEALRRHGLTVHWDGDPGQRIEVDLRWRRRRSGDLATWPDGPPPSVPGPDRLDVTYCDYTRGRHQDDPVPLSLAEARGLLLDLTPYPGNFAVFSGRTGGTVQVAWESGPRLWLEHPDPATRTSHGRHVTPAEAEDLLTVLATADRVALDHIPGHTARNWSD